MPKFLIEHVKAATSAGPPPDPSSPSTQQQPSLEKDRYAVFETQAKAEAAYPPPHYRVTMVKNVDEKAQREATQYRAQINVYRQRLIVVGCTVKLLDYADLIHVQGREQDKMNLVGLAMIAGARPNDNFPYRDAQDVHHILKGHQVARLFGVSGAWFSAVMQASWAFKAMPPTQNVKDLPWPPSEAVEPAPVAP